MKQPIPFGKYFLLERVNVGGMAEVFKAKTTGVEGFERTVAVKRILPGIAEDEEFVTMFVDEAKIAVQLTHANIAQIFDLGRADGSFYIALEYIQGKDLRAILNRVRQRGELLPIQFACYIIMKVCEGLDYAHNKQDGSGRSLNLVHRDVSPQNILVSYEGEVKLIDFGIVKAAGKAGKTQAGILKGKFGYMSPEQILGVEIDRRSDVFGVGICLYELLTGERLFAAESDFATLEKVKAGVIMPPSTYNARIPEELEQIVLRALAKDRNTRYATALALHDALQAFMHTSGSLFARKDLGLYMHRVFAEEIRKENASDAENGQLGADTGQRQKTLPPLPPPAANGAHPGHSTRPAVAYSPRRRTGTLLGVQPAAAVQQAPAAVPPFSGPASRPPLAIPSTPTRPPPFAARPASRPPAALPASTQNVEPPATPLQAAASAQSMEWDDDELSTQIYDKPERGRIRKETQEEFRAEALDDSEAAGEDANVEHDSTGRAEDDDLDSLQASVPDSMDAEEGLRAAQFTGHALVHPARHSDPGPQTLRLAPPPAAVPAVTWEKPTLSLESAQQTARGRPMLAAVLAVVAIIGLIVGALAAFRPEEPATVSLTTHPSRVDVAVDGHALGSSTSPFVIGELTPDRPHEIIVSSQGHAPWKKTVNLTPGQLLTLTDVALEPIETGFEVSSEPSQASVFIDDHDQSSGKTPLRLANLSPGEHRVRVELSGFASWESTLTAEKGVVLPLTAVRLRALPSAEPLPEVTARMSRRGALNPERERERERERAPAESMSAEKAAPVKAEPAAAPPVPEPEPATIEKVDVPAANPYKVGALAKAADLPEEEESAPQPTAAEAPASSDGKTGKLRVNSRPWSQVFIDGKSYGATPRLNIELPVGAHTLRLVNDEFKIEKVEQLQIVAGETRSVIINLLEH